MTSDFEGFYPRVFPLHLFSYLILILEKEPVFPFSMLSAKQGNYWYHFYNVFGMTRSLTGNWTLDLPHSSFWFAGDTEITTTLLLATIMEKEESLQVKSKLNESSTTSTTPPQAASQTTASRLTNNMRATGTIAGKKIPRQYQLMSKTIWLLANCLNVYAWSHDWYSKI